MINWEHVDGTDKGEVRLFALSTCVWCKKTKQLLTDLGVAYDFVFVDLVHGMEKNDVMAEMEKLNPHRSFPTLVIRGECIIGFKEDAIREALG